MSPSFNSALKSAPSASFPYLFNKCVSVCACVCRWGGRKEGGEILAEWTVIFHDGGTMRKLCTMSLISRLILSPSLRLIHSKASIRPSEGHTALLRPPGGFLAPQRPPATSQPCKPSSPLSTATVSTARERERGREEKKDEAKRLSDI